MLLELPAPGGGDDDDDGGGGGDDELCDKDATGLSHVGEAVHAVLGRRHRRHHHAQWNVTRGKVAGRVDDTPRDAWGTAGDQPWEGNDDWLPEKLADLIGRTEAFW